MCGGCAGKMHHCECGCPGIIWAAGGCSNARGIRGILRAQTSVLPDGSQSSEDLDGSSGSFMCKDPPVQPFLASMSILATGSWR